MSKRELIYAILEHNRTAAPEFLERFAENDLQAYLDRVSVVIPRGRVFRWIWDKPTQKQPQMA